MTNKLHSVLVEVDEVAKVIRIWRQFIDDKPQRFRLLELPLNQLSGGLHDAVTSAIGQAVLGGLADTHASLAAYRDESAGMDAIDLQDAMAIIKQKALSGDPLAQGAYGQMLCDRSLTRLDPDYLEEAEEWFGKAAASNDQNAVRFLEAWPKVKQHTAAEIAKRLNGI